MSKDKNNKIFVYIKELLANVRELYLSVSHC